MAIQNYADNGAFAPRKIVDALRTTSDELARSLGLGKDAIQRKDRIASDRTQRRLRQMVEVLNKVEPRFGMADTVRSVALKEYYRQMERALREELTKG